MILSGKVTLALLEATCVPAWEDGDGGAVEGAGDAADMVSWAVEGAGGVSAVIVAGAVVVITGASGVRGAGAGAGWHPAEIPKAQIARITARRLDFSIVLYNLLSPRPVGTNSNLSTTH